MRLLDDLDPFSFLVAETKKGPGFKAETKKFGSLFPDTVDTGRPGDPAQTCKFGKT